MTVRIHSARRADVEQLRSICIRTGDAGADASGKEDAPELLPAIFLEPYLVFAPDCAWVAEDGQGIFGYAVGVADSVAFGKWAERVWWPDLRGTYPEPDTDKAGWHGSDWLRHRLHHPPEALAAPLSRWPAHGHIDLLPRGHGTGVAELLMKRMMHSVWKQGARGIHLGVAASNARALRFYEKLGFEPVEFTPEPETVCVVRALTGEQ
ncbi:GNAT family N-acetyltransferase [Tropicimonas marinistellae]|uniref:GNAT family N-acetyltransferase n=1 Tax=Tropicimonas marinistellae TaxID=1739787 RepID=UPI0008341D0A|nr:GNAT family N-acetyltransferase [Tropicimonas marinistellae]